MEEKIQAVYEAVLNGAMADTSGLVQQALDAGHDADTILKEGLIAAMSEIGARFESGEAYVPEMLISAKSMKFGLELLRPHLVAADVKPIGRVVIGTIKGDLHDIGKNLVGMMMEGAGFEVIDLGADVKPEELIEAINEHKPNIVAMSALLTTTMGNMKTAIEMMAETGIKDSLKVMIGGAPVTQDYANEIGADGFGIDASQAAKIAKILIS
ncbi:MAG TPA: cobalamin-binding protein [Chloroflexi bacterium]|nr:MAG: cobalamin-binding protein [Chloroflexota bacterium]HDN05168.1 cobalamin-binding protein [Chloroflexota bacterium]